MGSLRLEQISIPAVSIGAENPLPPLRSLINTSTKIELSPEIGSEDSEHIGYGLEAKCLPYRFQDGYDRLVKDRQFTAAVLENEFLRATFILDLGGRLRSLVYKPDNRELLFNSPPLRFGNFAVRNAFFVGGVEWNMGVIGHTPLTCSPVFAARLQDSRAGDVLRLYEWERISGTAYQVDCYLPDKSPVLLTRIRIVNPYDHIIPMYWWSNIGIVERSDIRVLAPANYAMNFTYDGRLRRIDVPVYQKKDITWCQNHSTAVDFFFRVPEGQRPWITAVDSNGSGIFQASTSMLKGRKMFVFGMNRGSRHWEEFLGEKGHAFFEIQAGLCRTQAECMPMPAHADWSWLEAYGCMQADPDKVHGSD